MADEQKNAAEQDADVRDEPALDGEGARTTPNTEPPAGSEADPAGVDNVTDQHPGS